MDPNTQDFRPVSDVMGNYANHIWNGYPNNKEMSQILWHQTGYGKFDVWYLPAFLDLTFILKMMSMTHYYLTLSLSFFNSSVGCADAVSDPDADKSCTASVCFYAEAGNCGMGQIKTWDDHYQKIMNSPGCGPCPEDHPNCKE